MRVVFTAGIWLCLFFFILPVTGRAQRIPAEQSDTHIVIDAVELTGNKTTKDFIILRELPFSVGDTLPVSDFPEQLRLAKENLNNLLLFNFLEITPLASVDNPELITLVIQVEERWYIWPLIEVKLEERNLSTWLQNWILKKPLSKPVPVSTIFWDLSTNW